MNKPQHTPEPWEVAHTPSGNEWIRSGTACVQGWEGKLRRDEDRHRIVACVNALAGVKNPEAIRELIDAAWALHSEASRLDPDDVHGPSAVIPVERYEGLLVALRALEGES